MSSDDSSSKIRKTGFLEVPYNLNCDWYLRLANQAGQMLRGQIPVTNGIPILPP